MKNSKLNSDNPDETENTNLDDLLQKGKSDRKDGLPSEEFISPDSNKSSTSKNTEAEEVDSMGISEKAKKQASDERDVAENR
jgi:hypothetical protein